MTEAYLVGVVVGTVLNVLAESAYWYEKYKSLGWNRDDAGWVIAYGILTGLVWPMGVPLVFLLSGFYQHGFRSPFKYVEKK